MFISLFLLLIFIQYRDQTFIFHALCQEPRCLNVELEGLFKTCLNGFSVCTYPSEHQRINIFSIFVINYTETKNLQFSSSNKQGPLKQPCYEDSCRHVLFPILVVCLGGLGYPYRTKKPKIYLLASFWDGVRGFCKWYQTRFGPWPILARDYQSIGSLGVTMNRSWCAVVFDMWLYLRLDP